MYVKIETKIINNKILYAIIKHNPQKNYNELLNNLLSNKYVLMVPMAAKLSKEILSMGTHDRLKSSFITKTTT